MTIDVDLYRRTVSLPAPPGAGPDAEPVRFSVIDAGPRDALRTMVFVHGFGGRAAYWHYQLDHFHYDSRVIAMDLRGHGYSDAPHSSYSIEELCADLVGILAEVGAPEKFVLVAHSFGGALATYFTGKYPQRVERLVIIGSAVEFRLKWTGRAVLKMPPSALRLMRRVVPIAKLYPPGHVVSAQYRHAVAPWHGAALLKRLHTPTLVILGQRDSLFEEASQHEIARLIPEAEEIVIPVSAHQVMVERPDAVNRAIERFIGPARLAEERAARRTRERELERSRPWLKFYDSRTPYETRPPIAPVTRTLEVAARRFGKNEALRFQGRGMSYAALDKLSSRFAKGLAGLGVTHGERVAIVLPNIPQALIAYYGVLKLGAVVVFVNPLFSRDELGLRIRDAGARVLIALSSFRGEADAIADAAGLDSVILTHIKDYMGLKDRLLYGLLHQQKGEINAQDRQPAGKRATIHHFNRVLTLGSRFADLRGPEVEDLAVIAYTSGTTGAVPAGVMLTHANLAANALQLRHWAPEMRAGMERILAVVPFSHAYGITSCVNVGALIGATLILLPRFDLAEVLRTIAREKPSMFPGVPLMFQSLAHFPDVRKYGIASIRLCVSSGTPLAVEVQEEFEKLTRGRLVEAYGLTEASPATHSNPFSGRRRPGAIGLPLPDTEAKVVDPDTGVTLPPDTPGELVLRGPQVMRGYWQRPEETALALRDGWLYTGDIAKMDEDGFFTIIDRKKDIIFTAGYPVYPRDIEEVLYEHPGVYDAAVVGVPDWDEALSIRAFVVKRHHAHVTEAELMAHAKKRLPPYAVPATLEFVEALPRNALGKVLRRELARREGAQAG
ncbi:MAG: long-chain fatty acid--CoA ligase [Betaproteobacteria bacterium]|nr:long-chain fatty acid--CoA ligase [Betaproteobacteria bacterium]